MPKVNILSKNKILRLFKNKKPAFLKRNAGFFYYKYKNLFFACAAAVVSDFTSCSFFKMITAAA